MRKVPVLFPILILAVVCVGLAAGCGGTAKTGSTPASSPTAPSSSPDAIDVSKLIVGSASMSPQEISAAEEAIRSAQDSNTGSIFKATSVKCVQGWAKVDVEETEVPTDEAVAYEVFLRMGDSGRWEVAQTGDDLTAADLPDAPPDLFKN
jgi:hypothetical protein